MWCTICRNAALQKAPKRYKMCMPHLAPKCKTPNTTLKTKGVMTMHNSTRVSMTAMLPNESNGFVYPLLEDDVVLSVSQKLAKVVGPKHVFDDGSALQYHPNGFYDYIDGSTQETQCGEHFIGPRGHLCVQFENGYIRADEWVMNVGATGHNQLVLINIEGTRFPIV